MNRAPSWRMVPDDPDPAILRPFLNCPPNELGDAWRAALHIATVRAHRTAADKAQLTALRRKSTGTEAQEARILAALRTGPKTTDDLRGLGIYQASARLHGLRQQGYVVNTDLFNGVSADGYSHARMARYTLVCEPLPLPAPEPRQGGKSGQEGDTAQGVACQ